MQGTDIGVFSTQDARDIKEKVLGNSVTDTSVMRHTGKEKAGWHYGILITDLESAEDPLTGWTQATAKPLMYVTDRDSLDMNEVAGATNEKTVTNRSPNISGVAGDVILFRWVVKEWVVIWCTTTSSNYRHGIVRTVKGCGYYEIELGVWIGDLSTETESGSASDDISSSITNPCNVCYNVIDEGTAECGIELTYPDAPVIGTGTIVNGYHRASSIVPLRVGTACLMLPPANSSDDTEVSSSSAETSSASVSSSSSTRPTWQIVDGLQEHTVQYSEKWSCCELEGGTQQRTLLERTPVVFAALVCPAITCGFCDDLEQSSST